MSNRNISLIQSLYAAFGRGGVDTIVGAVAPAAFAAAFRS
jgi:hypothetical protein